MNMTHRWSVFVACLAAVVQAMASVDLYVSPGGTDGTNDCQNEAMPCATLAHALSNTTVNGETIHLAAGSYACTNLVPPYNVALSGAGHDSTFLQAASAPGLATDRVLWVALGTTVQVSRVTIRHGRTEEGLGGISGGGGAGGDGANIHSSGALVVQDCTFSHGASGEGGYGALGGAGGRGGIWVSGGLRMVNTTISDNVLGSGGVGTTGGQGGSGGGLFFDSAMPGDLVHVTLAGNSAGAGGVGTIPGSSGRGGGLCISNGNVALVNVLVAGNSAVVPQSGPDVYGTFSNPAPVLVGNTNGWVASDPWLVLAGQDPLLDPLTNNGGSTLTRRLVPTSPAVDAGDPSWAGLPEWDQRGAPRVQGLAPDLGAFEVTNSVLHVASGGVDGTNECRDAAFPCQTPAHAVDQAIAGDIILVGTGLFSSVSLYLDQSLSLLGAGAADTTLEAAADPSSATNRVLEIASTATVTVWGVTIQHGRAADGADGTEPSEPGQDGESGGGIYNAGTLSMDHCRVLTNRAGHGGDGEADGGSGGELGHPYRVELHRCAECSGPV